MKRGLTYGARGGISAGRFGGELTVSTFSNVDTTCQAIQVIGEEIERLRAEPPASEEVELAATYLSGSYMLSRGTPSARIGDHWLIDHLGLSGDYFERYMEHVARSTPESLAKVAAELFDTTHLSIIVVGPKKLLGPLGEIAPVEIG